MTKYPGDLVTPLFEITSIVNPLPFSMMAALERLRGWSVYREPPLYNHGSDQRYMCTHRHTGVYRVPYALSRVMRDPVGSTEVNRELFLRYQLNPYHPPHMPPPPGFHDHIFRNQRPNLREVFMEAVLLHPTAYVGEMLSTGSMHGACGVNVYTKAADVFSGFPHGKQDELVLIFSTVPGVREKLQMQFDARHSSPSLIVDDAFVSWGSLGLVSLNELHDMGALYVEKDDTGVVDTQWVL